MKYWLIFQVLATWPQSPQQLQIQGPFETKELCEQAKEQFDAFKIMSKCISVPQVKP